MALNEKQQRFVAEYLVDSNATKAAIRAGYSAKTAGSISHKLLKKAEISAAISAKQTRIIEKAELSAEYVLRNLMEIVERCMQRAPVLARGENGMEQAVDEEGRAVWEFNANGANKALELLGKTNGLKLFTDKVDHGGADGGALQVIIKKYGSENE